MTDANRQSHWETVYTIEGENEVSWFQENRGAFARID